MSDADYRQKKVVTAQRVGSHVSGRNRFRAFLLESGGVLLVELSVVIESRRAKGMSQSRHCDLSTQRSILNDFDDCPSVDSRLR